MCVQPIQAAVLTGGRSSRMGSDKALMVLDGHTVLERVLHVLTDLTPDVLIVGDRPEYYQFGVPVYADDIAGSGPLGGVLTALVHARHPHIFVAACDLPLLCGDLVQAMAGVDRAYDALVPVRQESDGRRYEPLHAIYSVSCEPVIRELIAGGSLRMDGLLKRVHVQELDEAWLRSIDPELDSLMNMNTPEDVERVEERMRTQ